MSSKREEEKNEKIIRGLMKLPPNRRCINCNSLGPQYVCTNFWTFVCITCSGIHREFTHRVKSVSMAKFTKSEVEALQNGGNQRAREIFLPDWDFQRTRLPDSSNPDRIRQFIKSVYVEKKYAGGKSSDKPPRNIQTQKSFEEDHRRASSYHSYSQSPPYDYQYEDRLYGKQSGMLTRKPGSDHGGSEKISSLIYSPGREDRFSNEISGPRLSDFSLSSASDSLKFDGLSPNFQKDGPGGSDPLQVRNILIEDGRSRDHGRNSEGLRPPLRSVSLGSLGLFTEKSVISEGPQPIRNPKGETLISSNQPSISQQQPIQSSPLDFFAESSFSSTSLFDAPKFQEITAPPIPKAELLDLFAEISNPSSNPNSEHLEKEGWASFDLPIPKPVVAEISNPSSDPNLEPTSEKERWAAFDSPIPKPVLAETSNPSSNPNSELFLEKERWAAFDLPVPETVLESKPTTLFQEPAQQNSGTSTSSQTWNAFDLSSFEMPQTASSDVLQEINLSFQKDFDKGVSIPIFDGTVGSSSLNPDAYSLGAQRHDLRSTNPFDIPCDSDPEPVKFLDMNPLQSTLPPVQFSPFLSQISQPSWSTYAAPVGSAGSFPYMAGQPPNSQPTEMQSQGSVSSLKGNPFE